MQLSYYTWLGIICYDTWRSFRDSNYKSAYCTYALYGYQLPFVMTLLAFVVQNSGIDDVWKPGITEYKCGLEGKLMTNGVLILILYDFYSS